MITIDESKLEALALGGTILGGGGGGSLEEGLNTAKQAFKAGNAPKLVSIDDMSPDDIILTISAVGAPSASDQFVVPTDYTKIIDLFEANTDIKISAVITNEMGGGSSFNAFIPSADRQIPMIDGSCNGRAHPLGTMGAMGLAENTTYLTTQTAVGGNPENNQHIELHATGSVAATSALVRAAAVQAGGLVVVARNAIDQAYVKSHGALGTISQSYEIGAAFLSGHTPEEKVQQVANYLGGTLLCQGNVTDLKLTMVGGLDKGSFTILDDENSYTIHIWNEYMAADKNQQRCTTFPDLLMTFDQATGQPVTSAELQNNQPVIILQVPAAKLKLGAGMYEKTGYQAIEQALGIDMLSYTADFWS